MKKSRLKYYTMGVLALISFQIMGQEAKNAENNNTTHHENQVAFTENTDGSMPMKEAMEKPFEISVLSSLDEAKGIDVILSEYAKPANEHLTLKMNGIEPSENVSLSYQVYNLKGKLFEDKLINTSKTKISVKEMNPDSYILMIFKNNQAIKVFKVIKNEL